MKDVRDSFPHPHWRNEAKLYWRGLRDLWIQAPRPATRISIGVDPYSFAIQIAIRYGMAENNKGT